MGNPLGFHRSEARPKCRPGCETRSTTSSARGSKQNGLKPSPEADRVTLLRRVTLDLTGLPPTPAEIEAFLKDRNPGCLRESWSTGCSRRRSYGERMAMSGSTWPATPTRTATTSTATARCGRGATGSSRHSTATCRTTSSPSSNSPATCCRTPRCDQKIATGFNRNHMINYEGGAIPEEYLDEYVVDRVDTTATAFLGLTIGCARCHDHKYDPDPQKRVLPHVRLLQHHPGEGARRQHRQRRAVPATADRRAAGRIRKDSKQR